MSECCKHALALWHRQWRRIAKHAEARRQLRNELNLRGRSRSRAKSFDSYTVCLPYWHLLPQRAIVAVALPVRHRSLLAKHLRHGMNILTGSQQCEQRIFLQSVARGIRFSNDRQ